MLFICLLFVSYSQNIITYADLSINNYSSFGTCNVSGTIIIQKSIKEYEFFNCKKLESIVFSNDSSVINIGNSAFSFCSNLESIIIPKSIKSIGHYAFHGCEKLKSVIFSDDSSIRKIGNNAFSFCRNLESIIIPCLVKLIENYSFYNCVN